MEPFFLNRCEELGQAVIALFKIHPYYVSKWSPPFPHLLEQSIILGPFLPPGTEWKHAAE